MKELILKTRNRRKTADDADAEHLSRLSYIYLTANGKTTPRDKVPSFTFKTMDF